MKLDLDLDLDLDDYRLIEMFKQMLRIRVFEERVKQLVASGELPGAVHISIGQEAEVVGACAALREDDYMTGNHRSHGHQISRGSPLKPLMAELMGKQTGICKGKGGSMHLADFSRGSLGESGVVGSSIPVATGAGLSARLRGTSQVALAFFGDGAANQGVLYESLNLAAASDLPVIYLCENNQYAASTPLRTVTRSRYIAHRAVGFGLPGKVVEDGQDVLAVYRAVSQAVARARSGHGPTLIEVITYRYMNHAEGVQYTTLHRDPDEQLSWLSRDPIGLFRAQLAAIGVLDSTRANAIHDEVLADVEEAVRFGRESPEPNLEDAFTDLYAEPIPIAR